jgi:hypothetical protein
MDGHDGRVHKIGAIDNKAALLEGNKMIPTFIEYGELRFFLPGESDEHCI